MDENRLIEVNDLHVHFPLEERMVRADFSHGSKAFYEGGRVRSG